MIEGNFLDVDRATGNRDEAMGVLGKVFMDRVDAEEGDGSGERRQLLTVGLPEGNGQVDAEFAGILLKWDHLAFDVQFPRTKRLVLVFQKVALYRNIEYILGDNVNG